MCSLVRSVVRLVKPTIILSCRKQRIPNEAKMLALFNTFDSNVINRQGNKKRSLSFSKYCKIVTQIQELHSKLYLKSVTQKNKIRRMDSFPAKIGLEKWLLRQK